MPFNEPTDESPPVAHTTTNEKSSDAVHVEAFSIDHRWARLSEPRRFFSLAMAVFCCIGCSTIFSFNLFSGELQRKYDITQDALSSINTVGLVFCYVALPYGALYDWIGPQPIFVLASILLPIGSLCFTLVFADVITGNLVVLCVFNGLMGAGAMMFDLGSAVTLLSHFPSNRGAVVAVAKTFTGLGSAVLGSIQLAFFDGRPDRYFLFLMSFSLVVGILSFFIIRLPPYHLTIYQENHLSEEVKKQRLSTRNLYLTQRPPKIRFVFGVVLVIILLLYLPVQSALIAFFELGRNYKVPFTIVVIVLLSLYPLMALPSCSKTHDKVVPEGEMESDLPVTNDDNTSAQKGSYNNESCMCDEQDIKTDVDYIAPQYQTTFLQSLCTIRLWAIFWAIFSIFGAELVLISNARFILAALSEKPVDNSLNALLTVLNGVGSGIGRLLMSALEIWSQGKKADDRIPITISLFFPTVSVIVAVVLFLILPAAALPLPYIIGAMGNGFGAAIIIIVSRTIFAKDVAKHYDFCYISIILAAVIFNRFVYGEWYAREAAKQGSTICYGKQCVMMPFLFFIGINLTAFLSNIYVHFEYRRFSARVLEERRRVKEEAMMLRRGAVAEPVNSGDTMPVLELDINGSNNKNEREHRD